MNEQQRAGGQDEGDRVRIDKWLWAARFFKTRSLATEAVDGGKVDVNGARVKPAKLVGVGDQVRVRVGPQLFVVDVTDTAERRGSATVAATLYVETVESAEARARDAEQRRLGAVGFDEGRPDKRDRRDFNKFRGR